MSGYPKVRFAAGQPRAGVITRLLARVCLLLVTVRTTLSREWSSDFFGRGATAISPAIGWRAAPEKVLLMKKYSACYGDHSHTKIAPLPSKITYIKMDPEGCIRKRMS